MVLDGLGQRCGAVVCKGCSCRADLNGFRNLRHLQVTVGGNDTICRCWESNLNLHVASLKCELTRTTRHLGLFCFGIEVKPIGYKYDFPDVKADDDIGGRDKTALARKKPHGGMDWSEVRLLHCPHHRSAFLLILISRGNGESQPS
ncbi:unnamed protein product [Boreogadus saida]